MARGGLNEATLERAYKIGFKGAALSSVIWKAEKPLDKFLEILDYCNSKGIIID